MTKRVNVVWRFSRIEKFGKEWGSSSEFYDTTYMLALIYISFLGVSCLRINIFIKISEIS